MPTAGKHFKHFHQLAASQAPAGTLLLKPKCPELLQGWQRPLFSPHSTGTKVGQTSEERLVQAKWRQARLAPTRTLPPPHHPTSKEKSRWSPGTLTLPFVSSPGTSPISQHLELPSLPTHRDTHSSAHTTCATGQGFQQLCWGGRQHTPHQLLEVAGKQQNAAARSYAQECGG